MLARGGATVKPGTLKHRVTLARAASAAAEERTLTCATCTAPTPREGEVYCLSCKMYWTDVDVGMFDQQEDY